MHFHFKLYKEFIFLKFCSDTWQQLLHSFFLSCKKNFNNIFYIFWFWFLNFDSYKIGININLIAIVLSEKVVIANKSLTLNCIAKKQYIFNAFVNKLSSLVISSIWQMPKRQEWFITWTFIHGFLDSFSV